MKKILTLILIILLVGSAANIVKGFPLYFSMSETDADGNPVWFNAGSYRGGEVRSNDVLNFRNLPLKIDFLATARDRLNFAEGVTLDSLHLEREPFFGVEEVDISDISSVRRYASRVTYDHNGSLMTWIMLRGDRGISIHQYPLGAAPQESLIMTLPVPNWQVIYVNGQVEIEGTLTGQLTIGSSGNMWLIDDVLISGTNRSTGEIPDESGNTLGLISERDIIIKNTNRNGRANGYQEAPENLNRHSIVITALMAAPNGGLRIQHTNSEDEMYRGPYPDERGKIIINGCLIQQQAYPLYYENHGGTGYSRVEMIYDQRYYEYGLVVRGFYDIYRKFDNLVVMGNYNYSEIYVRNLCYIVGNTTCLRFTANAGAVIEYKTPSSLIVSLKIVSNGTAENPVRIIRNYDDGEEDGRCSLNYVSFYDRFDDYTVFKHTRFDRGIDLSLIGDTLIIDSCYLAEKPYLRGNYIMVRGSYLAKGISLDGYNELRLEGCVVNGTVEVSGVPRRLTLLNNTIVNTEGDGVRLRSFRRADIRNNIIAFCRDDGIRMDFNGVPVLEYNNVFGNGWQDYYDCRPGIGSISLDPQFVDMEAGDFNLRWGSPCIDSGDPNSARDPDGSRADMGALFHEHRLAAEDKAGASLVPSALGLTVSPNPFNAELNIMIELPREDVVRVQVFDLAGRCVETIANKKFSNGAHNIVWSAVNSPAGLYIIYLTGADETVARKVALIR